MEKQKIRVLLKEPYKEPQIVEMFNDLKSMQDVVKGYIEVVSLPTFKGIDLVVNEEGKLEQLPGNFYLPHNEDCVVGNCIVAGFDDEGEFISLTDKQIEQATKYIKAFELPKQYDLYQDLDVLEIIMKRKMKEFDSEMN